ncbi:hypothetical protein FACS1894216_02270 [Synergistales bacterium]|nr:hypothetical protein FACS1894216_02270 [Synergistales bacterium]
MGGMDRSKPDLQEWFCNQNRVDLICRDLAEKRPDIMLLSPIHAFAFYNPFTCEEEALGMALRLLEMADELWVFGSWKESRGCQAEIKRAQKLGLPIVYEE